MTKNHIKNQFKVAEVELVYRHKTKLEDRQHVSDDESAYKILLNSWDRNKIELLEQFRILLLDNAHNCLGVSTVLSGGLSQCLVDPKILFATALKANASSIILAHNHPSGQIKPSQADIALTQKLK